MLSTIENNKKRDEALIQDDRWHGLCDITFEIDLLKTMVHKIAQGKLWDLKVLSRWMLKQLTEEQLI